MLREPEFKTTGGGQEPVRILLVEDDAISAEILRAQLRSVQSLRSRLEVVGRLSDALLKLAAEPFALVLADLNLPDSSGADTVAALAQASGSPIIVLTGDSAPDLRARCLELGAYDFIAKGQLTAAALDRAVRLAAIQARAQLAVQSAEARLSHLLQLSTDWHWEQDEHFRYTRFEGRVDELLGSDSRSAIGRARWEIPTNEPAAGSWEEHRALLEAHRPFRNFETRRRGDDGTIHHVVANGDPIFDSAGRFVGYRGVASDITLRKRGEAALRESEARFRSLTALSSDWYWEQDHEFRLTYMSSIEKTGLDPSAYLGRKRWDQPALNLTAADWQRHRAQLEAHEPFRDFEMERPADDGQSVWLSVSGEPVFDAQGRFTGYRGIGRDITLRKRSKAKISHLHRMYAALGAANEAVLRARSAQEVFERACAIAVDTGGFLLGVVYVLDERSGRLARAAASGPAASATEDRPPSLDETQSAHGLVAHAWRTGTAAISNDYAADPRSAARRGVARPYAVGSAAVFPLRVEGARVGVLALQHAQRDAFAGELTALLQRLADNISFALENFGREARRLQAERESRDAEARFRSLTSLSSDTYWEQDASYRFTKFTDTATDRLRTRGEDRLGKHRWDQRYFNMSEADWAAHRADMDARRPFRDLELGRVNDAGELVWVSVSGEPVFDESGAFQGYRGVGKDITPRKREDALQRLEHEATRLLAAAASPAEGVQSVLCALSASEGWKCARFFQLDEGAGAMRFDEAASYHAAGFEAFKERSRGLTFTRAEGLIGEVWRSGKPLWVADLSRDARVKWAIAQEPRLRSALVFPILAEGAVVAVASMSNDGIREPDGRLQKTMELIGSLLGQFLQRKQAEAALQQSEAWFRQTFELAGSGMAHVALDGTFIRVNRRLCEILGYEAGELIGRSVKQISHPEDRDVSDAQRARLRADETGGVQLEKRYQRRDGSTVWVDLTVALARDAQGTPLYEISIIEDITERKAAEAALRESEARFRSLTELSADFYWETDSAHRVMKSMHGAKHEPIHPGGGQIGKTRWELPSTRPDAAGWAQHRAALDARQPFRDFELARIDAEGQERHLSISGEPMFDAAGAFIGYRGVGKEITARKREEALLALEHDVTLCLAQAATSADGVRGVIRKICESQGFPVGRFFTVDEEAGVLRFSEAWGIAQPQAEEFVARSRGMVYARGQGLSGKVWASGEPLWVKDASTDPRALRSGSGVSGGAFVFPVSAGGNIIGVLSFSSSYPRAPQERVMQAMRVVGSQVGQFLMRKRAERKQRQRAEELQRFRAAMDMSFDAIYLTDRATMRFLDVNEVACRSLGRARDELLKMGPQHVLTVPREQLEREYDAVIAQGASGMRVETSYLTKEGRKRWTELHRRALRAGESWIIVTISRDITERKAADDGLRRFRAALDASADPVLLLDARTGTYVDFNEATCRALGYSREEMLGMRNHDIRVDREPLELLDQYKALSARPGVTDTSVGIWRRKDGSTLPVELTRRVLQTETGPIVVANARDLTERKRADERQAMHLRYQERVARFGQLALSKSEPGELIEKAVQAVLEALGADAVTYIETDAGRREVMLRALVGVADAGAKPGTIACAQGDAIVSVLSSGARLLTDGTQLPMPWASELRSVALIPVRGDDNIRGVLCACYRRAEAFGAEELNFVEAIASVLSAALQRIDSEGRLAYLAQFDPLTGLPNRTLLADRFSQMIVQAKRHARPLAVLFIDLDEFKMVNDTLGHAGGDALLKEVAVRLQSTVRSGDTVGRISGDEFAIVLGDLARADDAALVAQKIIDRLAGAVEVHGKEVFVTASVGIASFPSDGADAESLIGAADAAMYRAKQSGRNTYQFFTAEINQRSRARAQLGSELRRALEREEFALVYQAKYNLGNRRPNGAEALLRWKHPERGMVSPAEFIPVLEETGLILPVGEWVIQRACQDLKNWEAQGVKVGPVSVNLSARQFRLQDLDARIKALVSAANVDPSLIELEITESHLMQDPDHAIRVMRALCDAGMRIAIDDFGTGYSSLAYLTRFPVGSLKIDRSFVKGMSSDKGHATIVRTIVEMAHTLGFTVIAEGVETEEQASSLRQLRCEYAQGFLFAKPVPAADLAKAFSGLTAG
jgi:diguanylate cyclase (GGDEF)-like protein/PAS domain S-box-containing protein